MFLEELSTIAQNYDLEHNAPIVKYGHIKSGEKTDEGFTVYNSLVEALEDSSCSSRMNYSLENGELTGKFEKEFSEGLMSIDYTYRALESTKEEFLNKVFNKRGKQPFSFLPRVAKYSTPVKLTLNKPNESPEQNTAA